MARIEPRSCRSKDGAAFVVRSIEVEEAADFLAWARACAATTDQILTQPDELPDLAGEERHLRERLEDPGGLFIAAHDGRGFIGCLGVKSGHRRRNAHTAEFGMQVDAPWRGRGIGRALLQVCLDWAAAHPVIEKVCLGVYPTNEAGMALYRKVGFVEEGRQARQVKLEGRGYVDLIHMARWVKERRTTDDVASATGREGVVPFERREIGLRDGRVCVVRRAVEDDVPAMVDNAVDVAETSDHNVATLEDYDGDPGKRRRMLEGRIRDALRDTMIVAEVEGRVVGALNFTMEHRRRMSHHGTLGISVHSAFRGCGVGSALIISLLDWAAAHPTLERVRLGVFANNTAARRLYERLGFREECVQPRFFRVGPGEYVDDVLMGIDVKG